MRRSITEKIKIAVNRSNVTMQRRFLVFHAENGLERLKILAASQKLFYNRRNVGHRKFYGGGQIT